LLATVLLFNALLLAMQNTRRVFRFSAPFCFGWALEGAFCISGEDSKHV